MQLYYISLFILVLAITGASAKQDQCDPFYYLQTTVEKSCPKSGIFFISSPFIVEVNAVLPDNCGVKEKKTVSLVFSDQQTGGSHIRKQYPNEDYFFEYSIVWDDEKSLCIVDLVPDDVKDPDWMMIDQNGILNTPYEHLGAYAHKKLYTRRFILDANSPTTFRLALTCTRDPTSTKPEQRAMIEGIRFGPVNKAIGPEIILFKPSTEEFDCWKNTPNCYSQPPNENATCVFVPTDEAPVAAWYYKGGWYIEEEVASSMSVPGNLYVDTVSATVGAGGCIKPWRQDEITIGLRPDWPINLFQAEHCKIPLYIIEGRDRPRGVPQTFPYARKDCRYILRPDLIQKSSKGTNGSLLLSAPKQAWSLDCKNRNPNLDRDQNSTSLHEKKPNTNFNYMSMMLFLSLGVVGILLYNRYRRNRTPRVELFKPLV